MHYKAGDKNEMYFFNKYDAALRDKEMQQTFYINKSGGITAKEAYNLMKGRVHKQLENLKGEKYNAWIVPISLPVCTTGCFHEFISGFLVLSLKG